MKPANLFLQDDGGGQGSRLRDRAAGEFEHDGERLHRRHSRLHVARSRRAAAPVDERSDVFSVGAVLYLMLSGSKPFVAPDLPAVLSKVVSEDPPPFDPEIVPAGLSRIVFKALAKDPAERFQNFAEFSADLARWRRRYEVETRALAEGVARTMDQLLTLEAEERESAETLGVPPAFALSDAIAEIGPGFPRLESSGIEAVRSGSWNRGDIQEIDRRSKAVIARWEQQIAAHRNARSELTAAKRLLEAGNTREALAAFESVLRQVPDAPVQPLVTRAREAVAEEQARDDRLRSLLAEATAAQTTGRLQAALALVEQAVIVQPQSLEARNLLSRLQRDAAAADLEKARRCERCLARARRALQLEQFDEAAQQLMLATETGAINSDIAVVTAALHEARAARDNAGALVQEIAAELAKARGEFNQGQRREAIARLEALEVRHPGNTAANAELTRLRAEESRLLTAEQSQGQAEALAEKAAEALANGDAAKATELAEQALALVPSHEQALRTAAIASAQLREISERAARGERARVALEEAKSLLGRGLFDRAIKEARTATEFDPSGTAAPAVIAEAYRRRAAAEAVDAAQKETARRSAEIEDLLVAGAQALRNKDFPRARTLGERALAIDPENVKPREFIGKVASAASLAASAIEEDTVDLQKGEVDPEATAVMEPVAAPSTPRPSFVQRLWSSIRRKEG